MKRFGIGCLALVGGLVVLALIVAALAAPSSTPSPAGSAASGPRPAIGDVVDAGNWRYRVSRAYQSKTAPGTFGWSTAKGTWTIVELAVTNRGTRSYPINGWDFELVDGNGVTYPTDSGSGESGGGPGTTPMGGPIPPGVPVNLTLLFDTSPGATGLTLRLLQADVTVDLARKAAGPTATPREGTRPPTATTSAAIARPTPTAEESLLLQLEGGQGFTKAEVEATAAAASEAPAALRATAVPVRPAPTPAVGGAASSRDNGYSSTVELPVKVLPTDAGDAAASAIRYPAAARVPWGKAADLTPYGVAGMVLIGPAGWTGSGEIYGNSSISAELRPAGAEAGLRYLSLLGTFNLNAPRDAAAYFDEARQDLVRAGERLPAPLAVNKSPLGPGLIAYSFPSAGNGMETNGVAYYKAGAFLKVELALPAGQRDLATAILDAFIAGIPDIPK